MITEFEPLEESEVDLLLRAPLLVSILIAGADGKIDKSEVKEAIDLSRSKQKRARKDLIDYYREVGTDFEDKLKILISHLPTDVEKRSVEIEKELKGLNKILPKLDRTFAGELYVSLKDIAKKVAEASGGILGYMSIGYEESKFLDLKMVKDPAKY